MRAARLKAMLDWSVAPPDYAAGLRAAVATVLPLIFGEATGRPQFLWVALGGWLATFADPGGPYPLRAASLLSYSVASAVALFLGTLCAAHPWISIGGLLAFGTACAIARVYGEAAGSAGTLSLIAFAIALGSPAATLTALGLRVAFFAAGSLWAAALALALWPLHPYRPMRLAVAAAYRALAAHARLVASSEPGWFDAAARDRGPVRLQLETTRAVLASVRRGRSGESRRAELLVALYEAAELLLGDLSAIAESQVSLEESGAPRPPESRAQLDRAATALESAAAAAEGLPAVLVKPPAATDPLSAHLQLAIGAALALQSGAAPGFSREPPAAVATRSLRDVLSFRSLELRHALRVGVTAAAAALIGVLLHRARWYWIVVTAVLVLQPHGGATVRRGLQRMAGTMAGAMIAAVVSPLFHGQLNAAVVLFALAATAAALRKHNYAVYVMLMTPLFVLMAESASGDWHLVGLRMSSTLLGGAVALIGSLGFWPHRERERFPQVVGDVLQKTRALIDAALAGAPLHAARRQVGLALANADASFERFLDEQHSDAESEALMAVRSQSRRLVGAIIALSSTGKLPREAARAVAETLEALSRNAPPPPLPRGEGAERLIRPAEVIQAALGRLSGTFSPPGSH